MSESSVSSEQSQSNGAVSVIAVVAVITIVAAVVALILGKFDVTNDRVMPLPAPAENAKGWVVLQSDHTVILEDLDGKQYQIYFKALSATSGAHFYEYRIVHPDFSPPFVYMDYVAQEISSDHHVGEIYIQRGEGKWLVRYPASWAIIQE